jgi:cytochrome oxidase complex assembly protein 1
VDRPFVQPATARPNWWKRNWKWFVPLGCFGVALLFLAFALSIVLIVFGAMKSTNVYKEALARAKADPAVIGALGSPIKDGFFMSGNTNVNGASGESNLAIPIHGPKGNGTIYVSANKVLGQWNYSGLIVEVRETHQRIDLLHKSAPSSSR